ncbi:MAG: OmpP1/FadL family transporter [Myxococcota bacterium]|jgi:long-chain fatty acid transport protein|nr:outer membrane protein transport protein [Myxococcota bacterium]MBP8970262.1 outer membrane protein transport protein [Myxococcota bacterium]HHW96051.1 hypothetical protein [Oligoflexales bacterium]HQL56480.1 outer membrane protein transport protein [Myxococcota bacterium]
MKIRNVAFVAAFVGLMAFSQAALASGFFIQEFSAAGLGQGMALVASGSRPASQYQNVANLSFMEGLWLEATATTYFFDGGFENTSGDFTSITNAPQVVPTFFASYRINDWLAVGFAEFTAFGLSMSWPKDWEGRHLSYSSGLQTFTLNPNISFGPFKGFAVGVGFNAMYGAIDIKRGLTLGMNPPGDTASNSVHLHASAWGFGANVGVMYQPSEQARIGLAYRSGIKISTKTGKMDYDVNEVFSARFPDQTFEADINLPHIIMAGMRYWPIKDLSLELDLQWVQWSSYDELNFKMSKGLGLGPDARQMTLTERKDYHDSIQLRFGIEYKFLRDIMALRLGFVWDQNPVPDKSVDPMLPDSDRLMGAIGLGAIYKGFVIDIGYMPVFGLKRKVTLESGAPMAGTYSLMAHDLSVTLGYHWGGPKKKVQDSEAMPE